MTYFKTIVTLKSGAHKIIRLTLGEVAHVVSEFKKFRASIFSDVVEITLNGITLCMNEISSWKFINEYTREELLTI